MKPFVPHAYWNDTATVCSDQTAAPRDAAASLSRAKPLQDTEAMTNQEQLSGYDEDGRDRPAQLRSVQAPPSVPAASSPELRTLVAVAVSAIVVATLYIAQDVLIPITLAVMLSFVLSPLVDFLRRIGLWRALAVALSVLVALSAIGLIGTGPGIRPPHCRPMFRITWRSSRARCSESRFLATPALHGSPT